MTRQPALTTLLALGLSFAAFGQGPVKPIRLSDGSKLAAKNEAAVDLYLKGDLKGALKLLDEASLLDFLNPVPWLNGALANLSLGRFAQASRANQQAVLMGDRSIRQKTLAIEIDTARGQRGEAWRRVLDAEFQQPDDPYVHMARAAWADAAGKDRVAERSRWQAYRLGLLPMLDSKPYDAATYALGVGAPSNGIAGLGARQTGNRVEWVGKVGWGFELLGGPAKALQRDLRAGLSVDTGPGFLMGNARSLQSERPGPLSSTFFPSTPGAKADLDGVAGGVQRKWGPWTLNANYREWDARLRADGSSPFLRNNFQTQWMAEGRYDSGPWTAGAGISEVSRDGAENPAIEPLEAVFGQGRTRLAHSYLVHRFDPSRSIRLISGGVLTEVDGTSSLLLTAELAVKLFGSQYLRIGAKPTMNRVGTDLFPEDLRGRQLGDSSATKTEPLFGPCGKQLDLYAEAPIASSNTADLRIRAFQTRFTQGYFSASDPEQSAALNQARYSSGRVAGVSAYGQWRAGQGLRFSASATFQQSSGRCEGLPHETDVPNVPDVLASVALDADVWNWSMALSASYAGTRTLTSTGLSKNGVTETVSMRAPSVWSVDAHLSRPFGEGSLMLSGINLTRSTLYPGFGPSRVVRLSYQQRF